MLTRPAPLVDLDVVELAVEPEAVEVAELEPELAPLPPVALAVAEAPALAPAEVAEPPWMEEFAQLVDPPDWTVTMSEYAVAPVLSFNATLKLTPAWRSTVQVYEFPFWVGNCSRGVADDCPPGTRDK